MPSAITYLAKRYVFRSPYNINSITVYTGSLRVQTPSNLTMFLWSNLFIMSASPKKSNFSSTDDPVFNVFTATATYKG